MRTDVLTGTMTRLRAIAVRIMDPIAAAIARVSRPIIAFAIRILTPIAAAIARVLRPVIALAMRVLNPIVAVILRVARPVQAVAAHQLERNRKFVPLGSTILLFVVVYLLGWFAYPGMRGGQAFMNLFDAAPFLLVAIVGESFVIISGGIDLSVSGILALGSVVAASLLYMGWDAWTVFPIVLLIGIVFGFVMGLFITYLKVQPFIATLAGMWLARGLCYTISDAEVRIHDTTYTTLGQTKLLVPILSDPQAKSDTWSYITYLVVVAFAVFVFGLILAHRTRFGRTVYAMGGGNGANEVSARLMGLPVNRTKVLYSIYVMSGRGNHGTGFELTTIAACVIGGIALTGGEGYLVGALVGAMITSLIQALLQYDGTFSSYLVYIVIGALMLLFIGVQALVSHWNAISIGRTRYAGRSSRVQVRPVWYKRQNVRRIAVGAIAVVVLFGAVNVVFPMVFPKEPASTCSVLPMRTDETKTALVQDGAVIVYERNGGNSCVDELYAIYPDGRIVADLGGGVKKESQITSGEVDALLSQINDLGFFAPTFQTTHHNPCGACYQYSTTVTYQGETKKVDAVDGGADAPAKYWTMTGQLAAILYGGK
jgi:ribose/xylose/arabinose/galactoside ABC-type transport system permease subunit